MLWTVSRKPAPRTALVCHPHPLFGGTMHNKVVFQVAKTLHQQGIPVLRFNFRGAGLSEGQHDKGVGEREDVQAAVDYLSSAFPATPILLAGFSFGSWVGLRVGCADARVEALVGLGLPVNHSELSYLVDCHKPKLFLQGGRDQYGARERVEALFELIPPPKELVFVEDADHFFTGKLDRMAHALDRWLKEQFRLP